MPTTRLCSTLCVVTWTRSVRWLKILMFIPLGRSLSSLDLLHLLGDLLGRRQRLLVLPHQDDALDDVVLVGSSRADGAAAGRRSRAAAGADDHLGDLADEDRVPSDCEVMTIALMSSSFSASSIGACEALAGSSGSIPLPKKADGADVVRLAAQGQDVAADVGVGVLDRVFDLLQASRRTAA